jgi:hypothetical protein
MSENNSDTVPDGKFLLATPPLHRRIDQAASRTFLESDWQLPQ